MQAGLARRIDRNRDALVAFLRRRAPGDAEELAQDVWLRVVRSEATFATDEEFRAYAYTVARRLLIDHYRKVARSPRLVALEGGLSSVEQPEFADPEHIAHAGDVLAVVNAELASMKPEIAQVFHWRTAEDWSFAEIARRQGTGVNTALGRMHNATRRLAKALTTAGLLARSPFEDER